VLAVIAFVLIVLLIVGLIWYLIPIFDTNKGLTIRQRKDLIQGLAAVVQALAVVFTGTVGLIGLFFTWRNLKQTREGTEQQLEQARESQKQTQESTQRTLELTEQGQITERFTRAIDQLGATDDKGRKKLEIRLGGIYALERIDKESPERAYHPTVMEVLTAYVRENSRRDHEKPSTPTSASNEDDKQDKGVEQDEESTVRRPPADIQAILDVLNRREENRVPDQGRVRLDFRGANLQGADLQGADLQGANLQGANLYGVNLREAFLQEANFQEANLHKANLQEANLHIANLQGANLRGAVDLTQGQIEDALGNKGTGLPEDLHEPPAWSKNLEEQYFAIQKRFAMQERFFEGSNIVPPPRHRFQLPRPPYRAGT